MTRRKIGTSGALAAMRLAGLLAGLLGCLPVVLSAGCSDTAPAPPAGPNGTAAQSPLPGEIVKQDEAWNLVFMQGKRIGHEHTTITHLRRNGRELIYTESVARMAVVRDGRRSDETIRVASLETTSGRLLEVQGETSSVQVKGRVDGGQLRLEVSSRGRTSQRAIAWHAEQRGPFADQQTLRADPLEPGEQRVFRGLQFLITSFQPATTELTARDYENVPLLTGTHRLLRVDSQTRMPDGQLVSGVLWCDRTGEILKSDTLGVETFRTTREAVQEADASAEVDLIRDFSVPVARPLADAHRTQRVRYLVTLEDGDPAAVFVADQSQRVEPLDEHRARITVCALRPGGSPGMLAHPPDNPDRATDAAPAGAREDAAAHTPEDAAVHAPGNAPADRPGPEYRGPNSFIQSDDPLVAALARQAVGTAEAAWAKAVALERFAHQYIEVKDFSQTFATAAEVARDPTGDCTEHAVFLAALCRAAGLPSRVAVGLVYVPRQRAFGYHMWTEVFVYGQWIGLDATLGLGGIGGAHLKLAHHSLADASAFTCFLPVMQVIGRLEIEVEEVE